MNCCTTNGTGKFFSKYARQYEKYFRKKGLRPEQKHLAEGIRARGLAQASLLEIGCGVGSLHLSLLQEGASRVTGFDISERMIAGAQKLAAEMGLQERTSYQQGDFVALHETAPSAEITILDKVICCYENARELIATSAAKSRRVYAVSYPRESAVVRLFFQAGIFFCKLFRSSFRPYYHSPQEIVRLIAAAGFELAYERSTLIWAVQVFQRKTA
jgi:magnesium-protoporphyrin O-methyltransferase